MVKRYSFGEVFQTDSIPVIPEAQTGEVPYMEVNESEMSLTYTMDPEDIVYGLGENVRGINKRGWIYESKCSDESKHLEDRRSLYAAHNFIVVDGREKFGLFIDYPGILTFDVGYTELSTLKITASDWNLDVYVIEEDTVTDIIRSFRKLIGRSYIAPLWAFGNGQSRWGYVNAEDVREVVRKHRENGIPLDMVYLDIDYMERFKDFTVNKERFPDFADFVKEMKDQHIRLVPIIDAAVKEEKGYSVYDEGIEKGYFCTNEAGKPFVGAVWPGRSLFTDMLNKEARDWFGDQYKVLLDQGIEGFWNDMNEPSIFYAEDRLADALTEIAKMQDGEQNLDLDAFTHFKNLVLDLSANPEDYKKFYHTVNGKKIRNWSFYWDYDNRVSKWVAYPLYKSIFAGASRTDEWGYDPLLPGARQQNVSGGYKEGNNGWYMRGQQLPSADRAGFELNSTTFFSTNIVPQNSDFSGGLWMDLEGKVRSWAGQSDTCYVVSGCITKGAQYYVIDRSSEKVTVPTAFFKAVLCYSQATTIGTDGFCSIAFLFDHEEYSESGKSSLKVNKNMSISVKALEDALGYRLFVNLDNAIGEDKAAIVKMENPQNNNWWWK